MPRRDKRRYGRTAKDVRRGGLGTRTPYTPPSISDINVWLRVNGTNVANTDSKQSMTAFTERETLTASHIVKLDAGDYLELVFAVNDLNMLLHAYAADAVNPAAPSVSISVEQI